MKTKNYQEVKETIKAYARFQSLFKQDPGIPKKVDHSIECMDKYSLQMGGHPWRYAFFITKNKTAKVVFDGNDHELTFV